MGCTPWYFSEMLIVTRKKHCNPSYIIRTVSHGQKFAYICTQNVCQSQVPAIFYSSHFSVMEWAEHKLSQNKHGTVVSLPWAENTNYHLLLRENWSGCQPETTKKQVCSELEAGWQLSVSTLKRVLHQHELRGCRTRKKLLIQKQHLKAWLKFTADHMDKEKTTKEHQSYCQAWWY